MRITYEMDNANISLVRKQIQHMVKYRYVPFSFGKKTYAKNSS